MFDSIAVHLRRLRLAILLAASLAAVWSAKSSQATIITFDSSTEFSVGTPPAGSTPWLRAVFDDHNAFGSVDLTLIALNLTGTEFVTEWDINLNPGMSPTALVFSAPTKVGTFTDPVISKGVNAFTADGDGEYDVEIKFASGGGASGRFGVGESAKFTITGIPTLNAYSFLFLSNPHGGAGPFHMASHVQGIGAGGALSGWVSPDPVVGALITPEPSSWALAMLGAGGVAAFLRRRRK